MYSTVPPGHNIDFGREYFLTSHRQYHQNQVQSLAKSASSQHHRPTVFHTYRLNITWSASANSFRHPLWPPGQHVQFYSIIISFHAYPLNELPVQRLACNMVCKSQPHREVDVAFSAEQQTPADQICLTRLRTLRFLSTSIPHRRLSTETFCLYDNDSIDLSC